MARPATDPRMITTALKKLHTRRAAPWLALVVSGGLLVGAWIFQYGFSYLPCTMCYWQRHAHKVVIGLALAASLASFFTDKLGELLRWFIVLAFLASFTVAAWHVGVEFGLLEGPKECAGGNIGAMPEIDPNDPLAFLDSKSIKPPACSEAVWHFLGLSMAGWNALISLITALWIATSKTR